MPVIIRNVVKEDMQQIFDMQNVSKILFENYSQVDFSKVSHNL